VELLDDAPRGSWRKALPSFGPNQIKAFYPEPWHKGWLTTPKRSTTPTSITVASIKALGFNLPEITTLCHPRYYDPPTDSKKTSRTRLGRCHNRSIASTRIPCHPLLSVQRENPPPRPCRSPKKLNAVLLSRQPLWGPRSRTRNKRDDWARSEITWPRSRPAHGWQRECGTWVAGTINVAPPWCLLATTL
jgi:hypothetical protein